MTQNFIQPKGTLNTQTNVDDLTKQYAQMFANNQLQGQVQDTNPLRQTVNDLLQSKLLKEIEMPKYTTIQDIFNAQKGDKLNTFAEFLNNPQTMRMIGNFMPKYGYNPQTGKIGNVMEDSAKMQEALMQDKQQQAMKQMQEQYNLAQDLNKSFIQSDIADADRKAKQELAKEELDWKKAENALDRALKREELNAQIQHQRVMEGLARDRLSNSGGGGKKINQKTSNVINKNGAAISKIDALISMLEDSKNKNSKAHGATGFWQGVQAESSFRPVVQNLNNNSTEEQIGLRSQLADLGSMTITDRSGTNQTVNELKRLRPFIADAYDSPQTAIAKLKSMRNNIMNETNFYLQSEGLSPEDFGIGSSYNGKTDNTSQTFKVGGYTVRVKGK